MRTHGMSHHTLPVPNTPLEEVVLIVFALLLAKRNSTHNKTQMRITLTQATRQANIHSERENGPFKVLALMLAKKKINTQQESSGDHINPSHQASKHTQQTGERSAAMNY